MRSVVLIMLVAVSVSAISVIYLRHQHRMTYVALQHAQDVRDQLNIEWGQLLLEQSTWAGHHHVESEARTRLGMSVPAPEKIVVLRARP